MVLQELVNGLVVGSIFVLGAIGLTLVYGIRRFPNFAHGDIMTLGAYFALVANAGFVSVLALPPDQLWLALLLAAAVSMALTAGVGVLLEVSLFRKMHGDLIRPLIASIGLAFVIQNAVRIVWSTSNQDYGIPAQVGRLYPLGIRLTDNALAILVAGFLLVLAVHLILKYTILGKAMRATADNMELARVTGIDVQRVIYATWIMGAGLAAAAGILLGLLTVLRPIMGFVQLLPIFAAVILGGIGSPYGAMAGGLLIGVAQEVAVPTLGWLARVEVVRVHIIYGLAALAAALGLPGMHLLRRGRHRPARGLIALAVVALGLAGLVVAALSAFQWDPNGSVRLFFELGLQQPEAFKPAVSFIILVLVLLLLPQGIVGLAEKPKFKEFIRRGRAFRRWALEGSKDVLRKVVAWSR